MSTAHTTTTEPKPMTAAQALGLLLSHGCNTEQAYAYFLFVGGDAEQALRLVNEAHDQIDQLLASVALRLRTQAQQSAPAITTYPSPI